jgi:integrase
MDFAKSMPKGGIVMGSVYKNTPKAKYYTARFKLADGSEVRRSTKKTTRNEALKWLWEKEQEIENNQYVDKKVTLQDCLNLVIQEYEERGKEDNAEAVMNSLFRFYFKPAMDVREITSEMCDWFRGEYHNLGVKDSSINRYLAFLRRGLNLAKRYKLITDVPFIRMARVNNVKLSFLEWNEYKALHKALPDHLKTPLEFCMKTGIRWGELKELKWDQFDPVNRVIGLKKTKSGIPRLIYLDDSLYSQIMKLYKERSEKASEYIFTNTKGEKIGNFYEQWQQALEDANLPPDYTPHITRRTFARNASRAGVDQTTIMVQGGWETDKVFRRYRIVDTRDLEELMTKQNEYLQKQEEMLKQFESQSQSEVKQQSHRENL